MSNNAIKELNMTTVFCTDRPDLYVIPIYQRNYAWKEGQIKQLIHDIADYATDYQPNNYYIGTLVVFQKQVNGKVYYDTIDGQQRLTTLSILLSVLKNEFKGSDISYNRKILDFENRKVSSHALDLAFAGNFMSSSRYNVDIKNAYDIILNELKAIEKEGVSKLKTFINYLLSKVILLRVELPEETELNHYFEIMNSRGEQLEKHEVIKSKLLGYLSESEGNETNKKEKELFHLIWEGASQMEKYIQYNFPKGLRSAVFGSKWDTLTVKNFDELFERYVGFITTPKLEGKGDVEDFYGESRKIDDLIKEGPITDKFSENGESTDRFTSVINFPNFLLHSLSIHQQGLNVSLDDKRLINHFDFISILDKAEQIQFVKDFIFTVFKCRFLLDQYVIKRESTGGKDIWSLKRLYFYSDTSQSYINSFSIEEKGDEDGNKVLNDQIILLLSMFHTVTPNMSYKNWLLGTLNYLFNNYKDQSLNGQEYETFLREFATNIVFRIVLAKNPIKYENIIFDQMNNEILEEDLNLELLKYGNIRHNLVFNYIDYLLLQSFNKGVYEHNDYTKKFEFTPRSSVEHYYPQNPKDGQKRLDVEHLNSIGNLTLISHSKNSSMSNYLPKAKKEHYKNGSIADSIKQYLMFNKSENDTWTVQDIEKHEKEIISLLTKQIS